MNQPKKRIRFLIPEITHKKEKKPHKKKPRSKTPRGRKRNYYTKKRARDVGIRIQKENKSPLLLEKRTREEEKVDHLLVRNYLSSYRCEVYRLTDRALKRLTRKLRVQEKNRRFKTC